MDTKQYKIKSGKVTFASPVPHLFCTNGAWVQISANSKGKARAPCSLWSDHGSLCYLLLTLGEKHGLNVTENKPRDGMQLHRETGAWMSLDRSVNGTELGKGTAANSTTTNSTLSDQVVFCTHACLDDWQMEWAHLLRSETSPHTTVLSNPTPMFEWI